MLSEDMLFSPKTVFFFLDESKNLKSKRNSQNIEATMIGLLCVQGDQFLRLEQQFTVYRAINRLWGEVHYEKVSGNYIDKYRHLIADYVSNSYVTFHSRMFATPEKKERAKNHGGLTDFGDIFREESYRLIRSVVMKCVVHGYENFYILADEYTRGSQDYKYIKDRLNDDNRIPELNSSNNLCCTIGTSSTCGALQVCDILTSVLAHYKYHNDKPKDGCERLLNEIVSLNNNINPMDQMWNSHFPLLYSKKFQHYVEAAYSGICSR